MIRTKCMNGEDVGERVPMHLRPRRNTSTSSGRYTKLHPNEWVSAPFSSGIDWYLTMIKEIAQKAVDGYNQVTIDDQRRKFNDTNDHGSRHIFCVEIKRVKEFEIEGEGFGAESEERISIKSHSFVDVLNGDVYLPSIDQEPVPDFELGIRFNLCEITKDDLLSFCLSKMTGDLKPHKKTLIELLSLGANPDETNGFGETALMIAAGSHNREACDVLLNEYGANPDLQSSVGSTALMKCVDIESEDQDAIEICKLLLSKTKNVNLQNKWGRTALHLAAFRGNERLCELLLNATNGKLSKSYKDEYGRTPADNASIENCSRDDLNEPKYLLKLHELLLLKS